MLKLPGRPIEMLSLREKELIHEASCDLLAHVGVKVRSPSVIQKLTANGGAVFENGRLYLGKEAVDRALAAVPKAVQFDAPDPARAFTVEAAGTTVHLGSGGQALYVLHRREDGWRREPAGGGDLEEIVGLCDRLPHLDFVTRPVECDLPADRMDEEKARIFAARTTKPMNLANLVRPEKLPRIIEIVGGASYLSFIVCLVSSPLTVDDAAVEKLLAIAERRIPVSISSCAQGGTTAPLSEAGELIQLNAEVLFGIVFVESVSPGTPVLYRGIPITADLLTDCSPRWCQPDSIRRVALAAEICRFYGIPCCGTAGVSDEKEPTAQALSEKVLSLTYEVLAGAQYINSAFGMLERVMTVAPVQYVIDDMIIGSIRELLSGAPAEIPAAEVAKQVARRTFERLGVPLAPSVERELEARIAFIENRREEYTEEALKRHLETIRSAVESSASSSVFMKGARKGLRSGVLYTGERIEGRPDPSRLENELELTR